MRYLIISLFLFSSLQLTGQTRIMCLGNSITQGEDGYDSYRRQLWLKLTDTLNYDIDLVGTMTTNFCGTYPNDDFDMDHEGHWGWRIDEVLFGSSNGCAGSGRLGEWITMAPADIILVHLGTNDCWQGNSLSSSAQEIRQLIDTLRSHLTEPQILLAQLIPHANAGVNSCISSLNDSIVAIALEMDNPMSRVITVDLNTGMDPGTDLYDSAHPNEAGELKMAQAWVPAVEPFLDQILALPENENPTKTNQSGLLDNFWEIYPNPTIGEQITIKWKSIESERITVQIFSAMGEVLYLDTIRVKNEDLIEIDRHDLGTGIYFIAVSTSFQRRVKTFIID